MAHLNYPGGVRIRVYGTPVEEVGCDGVRIKAWGTPHKGHPGRAGGAVPRPGKEAGSNRSHEVGFELGILGAGRVGLVQDDAALLQEQETIA